MHTYLGAVVDWPTFWFWFITSAVIALAVTVVVMSVIVRFLDDLDAKRSWLRIDPRAVQVPSRNG